MIHIHPFPARMAPEIALNGLTKLPKEYIVLDPMSGSGMVLGTAAKLGISAIGYDLDPLACMLSRVNGTFIDEDKARKACEELLQLCNSFRQRSIELPWIDDDEETLRYIDFWFGAKQQRQLRLLSHFLVAQPFRKNRQVLDILRTAVSRLIVTKEPKASLARDAAHSRPHKTISKNEFDILEALPASLDHVLKALEPSKIESNVKTYRGDARKMGRISDNSVHCIMTSPPYLNAIDYIRGHRLSLVWLGYSVPSLRKVRARSVGTEIMDRRRTDKFVQDFLNKLSPDVDERKRRTLRRYSRDLCAVTDEAFRVLKTGGTATYVIGNSTIKGHEISNSNLLISAAKNSGFKVGQTYVRDIPENRRYMPVKNSENSTLSKRMRSEHVIVFEKAT